MPNNSSQEVRLLLIGMQWLQLLGPVDLSAKSDIFAMNTRKVRGNLTTPRYMSKVRALKTTPRCS